MTPIERARARYPMPEDASPYKHAEISILREGYAEAARDADDRIKALEEVIQAVCDGVERASSDNVAGANMRVTVPSLRALLTAKLNSHD